jgi:tRNA threonylcarbamoyl adenosine modification protein (Sua5/YciO/YrdC/YwlC family)
MNTLTIYPGSINERYIDQAVDTLRNGGIIIYPTDTLYALGCDALNQRAIERLCRVKGINPDKQLLSVVCCDLSQAAEYARIDNRAFRVLKTYLPGAFTFILPASTTLPKVFKGRKSVGVRIPDNDIARALAEAMGNPILSTSIEFDADQPAEAEMPDAIALRYSNDIDLMIDGGEGTTFVSTVVDLSDSSSPELVRQGLGEFDD